MTLLNSLHGTVAALLLCALLLIDESGVPMPFAPSEVLLLVAGLLIGTDAMPAWLFLPLALLAMTAGALAGFTWARAIGSQRLGALAARVGAERTYERAVTRIKHASPREIMIARLIPGIRTYTTLVAGAGGVPLRTFVLGAIPGLVIWTGVLVGIGVAVGAPAMSLLSQVHRLATTGALLVLLALGGLLAARHVPTSDEDWESLIECVPSRWRLAVAATLDVGIVATLVAGLDRITRSFLPRFHPNGFDELLILLGAVAAAYLVITRRGPGMTAGERLLSVSYRLRRGRGAPAGADGDAAGAQPAAAGAAPAERTASGPATGP